MSHGLVLKIQNTRWENNILLGQNATDVKLSPRLKPWLNRHQELTKKLQECRCSSWSSFEQLFDLPIFCKLFYQVCNFIFWFFNSSYSLSAAMSWSWWTEDFCTRCLVQWYSPYFGLQKRCFCSSAWLTPHSGWFIEMSFCNEGNRLVKEEKITTALLTCLPCRNYLIRDLRSLRCFQQAKHGLQR